MKLFNTLTRRKEEFVPLEEGKVRMYVCGPTVYNLIHIGNARPMIIFDTVRRYMEYKGSEVNYVSNFTDVDDKIIKKAIEEGVSAQEISERYIAECKKDMDGMNVKPATTNPQATQEIDGMISMIQTLVDKGYAYPAADGTVYFRVKKFKEYGKLSHKNLDDLQSGFREIKVTGEEGKEDPTDFVLWKPKKEGEPAWESPWSEGRPGWHIECSCISMKHLGEYVDIHCGGVDNIFPHHTNEIAQSESYLGHTWCKYWFHVQHLNDKSGKMSKSKGDFLTVSLLQEKGYDPIVYRMFCLQSHYRKPLEFSYEVLDNMAAAYKKLTKRIAELKDEGTVQQDKFDAYKAKFEDAISNDLNTSMAITIIYDLLKDDMNDKTKLALINDFDKVLSLNLTTAQADAKEEIDAELESYVLAKIEERKEAKKAKDFAKADAIRDELLAKGIVLKDTREGVIWHKA